MDKVVLNIDDREVEIEEGKTVLEAALVAGIYIPHLCHHPDLASVGACRLCVIEVEGRPGVLTSCTTPAEAGMEVKTKTPQIDRIRRLAMELILAGHPAECTSCPKYLNCELQSLKQYLGVEEQRLRRKHQALPVNTSNPLFLHDLGRCVLCGRCVRACHELRGVGVLSLIGKGSDTRIGTAFDRPLVEAGCIFCGACVEVCPTGALRDHEGVLGGGKSRKAALIPCRYTCPAGIDIPNYIRFIKEKNYPAALAVIREKVPFPASLGYVCDHPCEAVCRRGEVNEAISIRELKHFVAGNDDGQWKEKSRQEPATGKRVAVIGSGPAGLTAAYYLAKLGHDVTVFEALPVVGGMMRVGIPAYRLPREVLDAEIEEIKNAGVKIVADTRVESLDRLFEDGYEAILVAIGTHQGQKLPLPGADLEGVLVGVDFLREVNLGNDVKIGKRVLVLGGGNVAFDCARTALRLGAEEATVACLEAAGCMLATDEEIAQGQEEGVLLHNSRSFTGIVEENGRVGGVTCLDVQSFEFDEDGDLNIETAEGSEHVIPADTVIFAIGQRPDIPEPFELSTGRGNTIEVDEYTYNTDRDGVFAAGDAIMGTSSVVKAIASGRDMASAIDSYLGGSGIIDEELAPVASPAAWVGRREEFAAKTRCEMSALPLEQRLSSFAPVAPGYDEETAVAESQRCLQCDLRLKISTVRFWADYPSH